MDIETIDSVMDLTIEQISWMKWYFSEHMIEIPKKPTWKES